MNSRAIWKSHQRAAAAHSTCPFPSQVRFRPPDPNSLRQRVSIDVRSPTAHLNRGHRPSISARRRATRRRPPEKFSRLALRKRRVAVDFGLFFPPAWGSLAGALQLGEFGLRLLPRLWSPLFSGFAFADAARASARDPAASAWSRSRRGCVVLAGCGGSMISASSTCRPRCLCLSASCWIRLTNASAAGVASWWATSSTGAGTANGDG